MSWGKFIATVGLFGAYGEDERFLLLFQYNSVQCHKLPGIQYPAIWVLKVNDP